MCIRDRGTSHGPAQSGYRGRPMTALPLKVEVTTIIHAPRSVVFEAWLTPARPGRFLCAEDTHVSTVEVDARVNGEFRVVMSSDRGNHEHRGRYLEIGRFFTLATAPPSPR